MKIICTVQTRKKDRFEHCLYPVSKNRTRKVAQQVNVCHANLANPPHPCKGGGEERTHEGCPIPLHLCATAQMSPRHTHTEHWKLNSKRVKEVLNTPMTSSSRCSAVCFWYFGICLRTLYTSRKNHSWRVSFLSLIPHTAKTGFHH